MTFQPLLDEVEQLNGISMRLEQLSERHTPVTAELLTIAGSIRNTATLLAVLIATKFRPS